MAIERIPCEFFLLRYVPDAVKNEFVNIGVLLRDAAKPNEAVVRFTRDWSRVRCMDPDADTAMLEALENEIATRLRSSATDFKPIMGLLEDTLSNSIQITEARACLAESVPAEMEQLLRLYVEPVKIQASRRRTGRAAIAAAMRTEFERAGVWELMRKRIAASLYTRPGDPLRLDCGYRPNGVIRIFHAVSLEGDLESAKVLAFAAPSLREGMQRVEGAKLELTAVVEALRQREDAQDTETVERYRFGMETMEREGVRVLPMSELAGAAMTARRELRLE